MPTTLRLILRLLPFAAALAVAAPASASEPYWTQKPELFLQGSRIFASNGGWSSNSGPVTKTLYRFLRDGVVVKGLTGTVPKSTPPRHRLPGVAPDSPSAQYYSLGSVDSNRCFVAEVWGGTRSAYRTSDGVLLYDVWEWGHLNSFGARAVTNQICVGEITGTAPPDPPVLDLVISPQTLAPSRANAPYREQLRVMGGPGPYSFSVTSGALPKGIVLSPEGVLAGTPDVRAGAYRFEVSATDADGAWGSLEFELTVLPPRIRFVSPTLPPATRGRVYRASLAVSGGSPPYAFRLASGKLPAGLRLARSGRVSGRPTRAGSFGFTVEATDRNGATKRRSFGLRVR